MKKMVAILIAGIAVTASAVTNTVSSANVVGYIQVVDPVSNKYVLISAPFNSGTGTVSTLLDIFGTNQLRQSQLATRCDLIIMWDEVSQQYVRYGQKTNGLFYLNTAFTGSPTNPIVKRGQAMWLQAAPGTYAPTNKIIYISGDVPNDDSYTNHIVGNSGSPLTFIANPYPVEMDLNSLINTNDGAIASALATRADQVRIWDDATQQYVYYALKASANTNVNNKWLINTSFAATNPPVVKIKPGQGFWYQTTNAFTWVETKPYNLN
ncbi:MAG TPA: hypothetical protein PKI68_00565 [Pontiellaceae bacterium]|nr:hypothetical protein [Pontiellaceae bacterium]